jgi:hypothetical protein
MPTKHNPSIRHAIALTTLLAACADTPALDQTPEQMEGYDARTTYAAAGSGGDLDTVITQTVNTAELSDETAAEDPSSLSDQLDTLATTASSLAPQASSIGGVSQLNTIVGNGSNTLSEIIQTGAQLLADLISDSAGTVAGAVGENSQTLGGIINTGASSLTGTASSSNTPATNVLRIRINPFGSNPIGDLINAGTSTIANGVLGTGGSTLSDLIGSTGDSLATQVSTSGASIGTGVEATGNVWSTGVGLLQAGLCTNLACEQSSECLFATLWGCELTTCVDKKCVP